MAATTTNETFIWPLKVIYPLHPVIFFRPLILHQLKLVFHLTLSTIIVCAKILIAYIHW